ncbi:MAG: acyl-ACP--UDP-N-acetylglucosamine O-acyltransferase [Planctomycetes bacterium]|nr:acyl-ACP--UDP-N-acetylglucosamine O-acyltransferase [Planctomycetota bacterium]MBI3834310.1 acyl-ACP--UDP-N-acetylglucosamine O-acyltransferase [Planctomycetota bacterium]
MSIHPTAIIERTVELDSNVTVGPYCVLEGNVQIASGCRLAHNVYVTGWTHIDADCELNTGVIVGHTPQDLKYKGERSYCRIGKGTILREYVTVHRGTLPESETVIGENCFLLGGSHVAHNCKLGKGVTLVNGALLAGHVEIRDGATLGGGALVHQFVRIGECVMITGNARVPMDVPPFAMVDPDGRVCGLNRIGMRRAGISPEQLDELRKAYRILYGSQLSFREAIDRLSREATGDAGRTLLNFLQADSRRGITGRSRRTTSASSHESD